MSIFRIFRDSILIILRNLIDSRYFNYFPVIFQRFFDATRNRDVEVKQINRNVIIFVFLRVNTFTTGVCVHT